MKRFNSLEESRCHKTGIGNPISSKTLPVFQVYYTIRASDIQNLLKEQNMNPIPNPGHNICLMTDSYKMTHWKMYPPDLEVVGSYLEARKGCEYKDTVFFGLQYLLKRYFEGKVVTEDKIEQADQFCKEHFGQDLFNRKGWEYILNVHGGKLPVDIHAVPEGNVIPENNVLLTISNTDEKVPWLTNHLETVLVQIWYGCTIATISREMKKMLKVALEKSGTVEKLPFMLHNFGYRGSTSIESAAIADAAHLVNFSGTDSICGIELVQKYYSPSGMVAFSVPAAEHSVISAWGEPKNEFDAFRHIMDQYSSGLVSVVSDTYDIINACQNFWAKTEFSHENQTVVVRPDSGDPKLMIPRCLDALSERGYLVNYKGYKVLPDNLRMIWGDGISRSSLPGIVEEVLKCGWSLDNLVFGSGGGLVQDCDRDIQRFAAKASWVKRDGQCYSVYKKPASDMTKASKAGRVKLFEKEGYLQDRIGERLRPSLEKSISSIFQEWSGLEE